MKKIIVFISFVLCSALIISGAEAKSEAERITEGKVVSMEYSLRLLDGTMVDSTTNKKPFVYMQGAHQIIPGLERQLLGLKVGDKKKIEVSPEEGYGKVDPAAFIEIPKDKINPTVLKVGETVFTYDSYRRPLTAKIKEIKDATVILDLNHPLAGKRLYFDVEILKIEDQ